MTRLSRCSSLNILQARMVERLTPWAEDVIRNEHFRNYGIKEVNDFLRSRTVAEYEKAVWVYNNRIA